MRIRFVVFILSLAAVAAVTEKKDEEALPETQDEEETEQRSLKNYVRGYSAYAGSKTKGGGTKGKQPYGSSYGYGDDNYDDGYGYGPGLHGLIGSPGVGVRDRPYYGGSGFYDQYNYGSGYGTPGYGYNDQNYYDQAPSYGSNPAPSPTSYYSENAPASYYPDEYYDGTDQYYDGYGDQQYYDGYGDQQYYDGYGDEYYNDGYYTGGSGDYYGSKDSKSGGGYGGGSKGAGYGGGRKRGRTKGAKRRGKFSKRGGKNIDCGSFSGFHKDPYDLKYRFNKFDMDHGYSGPNTYLDWDDYPLHDDMAGILQHQSNAYSVVTKYDYEVQGVCIEHYIHEVGGYPSFPSKDPYSPFWKDFEIVVRTQIDRRNGKLPDPTIFTLPYLWQGWSAYQVAEAVHNEYPGTNHVELIKYLLHGGLKIDYHVMPFRSKSDFIGTDVLLSTLNTWSIGAVGAINFYAKWHVGRPRPEEIAWLIYNDQITVADGVGNDLYHLIKSMNLQSPYDFTQYPEGCPRHPAWPAMHSAASSASLWLAVVADLTPEQYCQVLRTDYAVAYGRTVAGVHYPTDNLAGLNMGQAIIADKLAYHLSYTYGCDEAYVQEKIDRYRFDWRTFSPAHCTVKPLHAY